MDVVALGELLIDFTENGVSGQGNPLFEANPGGAPCNVLAMLSRLGHRTAFIGKVGNDFFGKQLEDAITEVGIDAAGLLKDEDSKVLSKIVLYQIIPCVILNAFQGTGAYVSGWGPGFFILPQSGRGHDADGRRTAGGNNPWSKNLSFRNVIHDASGCPRSNEKSDRGRKRSRCAHFL